MNLKGKTKIRVVKYKYSRNMIHIVAITDRSQTLKCVYTVTLLSVHKIFNDIVVSSIDERPKPLEHKVIQSFQYLDISSK